MEWIEQVRVVGWGDVEIVDVNEFRDVPRDILDAVVLGWRVFDALQAENTGPALWREGEVQSRAWAASGVDLPF